MGGGEKQLLMFKLHSFFLYMFISLENVILKQQS